MQIAQKSADNAEKSKVFGKFSTYWPYFCGHITVNINIFRPVFSEWNAGLYSFLVFFVWPTGQRYMQAELYLSCHSLSFMVSHLEFQMQLNELSYILLEWSAMSFIG